mmetsp:Transcript_106812/g.299017  ORF Transcript_106812/g.299017 Transcript_106812/m.299017 type:complete len:212 (+) Transcript_106812:589-1224(+)
MTPKTTAPSRNAPPAPMATMATTGNPPEPAVLVLSACPSPPCNGSTDIATISKLKPCTTEAPKRNRASTMSVISCKLFASMELAISSALMATAWTAKEKRKLGEDGETSSASASRRKFVRLTVVRSSRTPAISAKALVTTEDTDAAQMWNSLPSCSAGTDPSTTRNSMLPLTHTSSGCCSTTASRTDSRDDHGTGARELRTLVVEVRGLAG